MAISDAELSLKYGVRQYQTGSAYELLREGIFSGRFLPGAQLNERLLGEEFRLSRTPVRQALTRLAAGGIVEQIPHVGAFVRNPVPEELLTLLEFRRALESGVAALTAQKVPAHEAADLVMLGRQTDESTEKMAATPNRDTLEHNRQAEIHFHCLLLELSGNRELKQLVDHAAVVHLTLLWPEGWSYRDRCKMLATHEDVAKAIATGEPRAAFGAVWDHFQTSIQQLTEKLRLKNGQATRMQGPQPK